MVNSLLCLFFRISAALSEQCNSTLQPTLKLPPLRNVKYLKSSSLIILQIVCAVPSISSLIMQVTGLQVTLTIAAMFESGNKLLSLQIWYVLKNQSVMVTSSVVCSYCYVIITPQTFKEMLSIVWEVSNHVIGSQWPNFNTPIGNTHA